MSSSVTQLNLLFHPQDFSFVADYIRADEANYKSIFSQLSSTQITFLERIIPHCTSLFDPVSQFLATFPNLTNEQLTVLRQKLLYIIVITATTSTDRASLIATAEEIHLSSSQSSTVEYVS